MPSRTIDASGFSPDIFEFLRLLEKHKVRCLIVGGEAVIFHGHARVTADVDFFFDLAPPNVSRLFSCLLEFWNDRIPGIKTADELLEPGVIIQFGRPPHRIDLMNTIDGVSFADAWKSRHRVNLSTSTGTVTACYVGLRTLIKNKRASARPRDLEDVSFLERKLRRT